MRLAATALLVLSAGQAAALPLPRPPAGTGAVPVLSPVGQLRLAVQDLAANVTAEEAPYAWYFSHYEVAAVLGTDALADWRRAFRHEINKRNAGRTPLREFEVDGPNGLVARTPHCTLVRVFITDAPNWTRAARVLVADRDVTFREAPLGPLPHREVVFGRLVTGIAQNERTLAAGFIVNAWQLYRDVMELARSESGFDLLYAFERHPDKVPLAFVGGGSKAAAARAFVPDPGPEPPLPRRKVWPAGKPWADGRTYPQPFDYYEETQEQIQAIHAAREAWRQAKAAYQAAGGKDQPPPPTPREAERPGVLVLPARPVGVGDAGKGDPKFPRTVEDFERRWGAPKTGRRKGAAQKDGTSPPAETLLFDRAVGGLALAHDSDPVRGSIVVAGGDRGVEIVETGDGFVGTTYDYKESRADKDIQEKFLDLVKGRATPDGGEALGSMPMGCQAELLYNGEGQAVAVADTDLAKHLEAKSTDPRYPEVRVGFCGSCHAASSGYMSYVEQYRENQKFPGVKYKVPHEDAQRVRDFFLSWDRRVKRWRSTYDDYLEIVTTDPATRRPWTGAESWAQVRRFRDEYDKPVDLRRAAAALGYAPEALRWLILKDAEDKGPPQVRLNQLGTDRTVPRRTWEQDVFRDACLWIDLTTPPRERVKDLVAPQVLEDAVKRFGHKELPR